MNAPINFTRKCKNLVNKVNDKALAVFLGAGSTLVTLAPAHAATDIDDIFTAGAVTGLSTNVKTLLLGFIGITVMFVGYKYFKRAANRG